jgi:parallel beta-helix repeat protein
VGAASSPTSRFASVLLSVLLVTSLAVLLLTFSSSSSTISASSSPWWDNHWGLRKSITIDHTKVAANLTNFPVLIDITDNSLKSHAQGNGNDIAFTDNFGVKLNHQIELYDNTTGHLVAWVGVPSLSLTDNTIIYMYYGNPTCGDQENSIGVWDSNYVMVQHLNQTSGTLYDSTSYNNNGTPSNVSQGVSGKIDGATNFSGSATSYVDCGSNTSLNITGAITIEAWIKPASLPTDYAMVVGKDSNRDYDMGITPQGEIRYHTGNGTQEYGTSSGANITAGSWYHIITVRTVTPTNQVIFYANGSQLNTYTFSRTPAGSTVAVTLGSRAAKNGNYPFNGTMDEVRILNVARSASWISTEFNNENSPSTFYSVGSEEFLPFSRVSVSISPTSQSGANGTTLNYTITVNNTGTISDNYFLTSNNNLGWSPIVSPTSIPNVSPGSSENATLSVTIPEDAPSGTIDSITVIATSQTDNTVNGSFGCTAQVSSWWNRNWPYRKEIVINHNNVVGNLTNFSVLIDITDNGLRSHAQGNGHDIVFTDNSGSKLNHQTEVYDNTNGHLVAWVGVPSLSSMNDTILFMYYGNPACSDQENSIGVWDSNYVMVQHLNQTSGILYDSTSYNNNGTPSNVTLGVNGKIDGADNFNGVNGYVDFGNATSLKPVSQITVEAWAKFGSLVSGIDAPRFISDWHQSITSDRWIFSEYPTNSFGWYVTNYNESNVASVTFSPNLSTWYHLVGVYDGSAVKLYVNGSLVGSSPLSGNMNGGGSSIRIGEEAEAGGYFNGIMDEVRISNVARSAAWISTEYNNENNPSGFYIVGSEEVSPIPVISNVIPENGAVDVLDNLLQLSFTLTQLQGKLMNYCVTTLPDIGHDNATGVGNGTYTVSISGLHYSTTYTWTLRVTDGTHWENENYNFTTKMVTVFNPFANGWQYRKRITIDHTKVEGNLTNFPILIDITDSDLASRARTDGDDIVFMDNTGVATKLRYEIEHFDSLDGHLTAWVEIPQLYDDKDVSIYIYYGNPFAVNQENVEGVWDSNYVMVQHLDENSGTNYDSASYSNNGTPNGGVDQGVVGKIEGAENFNGSTSYVEVADSSSLDGASSITLEAWINPLSSGWSVKREITINNSGNSNALTGYPISVNVTYENDMRSDFGDLRFVDDKGNILDYWVENYNLAENATVWVKVPEIPANDNKTIWMYYGNPGAKPTSDVDNIFDFFDNFSYIGNTWVENPNSPVLQPSGTGWDSTNVIIPRVIYDNGTYFMYYLGANGDQWSSSQIGVATSKDGVHFTRYSGNPIIPRVPNTWQNSVMTPSVIKVGDTFYMIYMAADTNHYTRFGLATSTDGFHFTEDPDNPVFDDNNPWIKGLLEAPALSYFDGTFYLYYSDDPFTLPRHTGVATSTDCKHWTPDPNNPIVKAGDGGYWTDAAVIDCQVVKYGGEYVMCISEGHLARSPPDLKLAILRSPNPNFYPKSSVVWDVNNPQYSPSWGVDAPCFAMTVSDNNTVLVENKMNIYYTNCAYNYLANAVPGVVINPYKWIFKSGSWRATGSQFLQNYGVSNDQSLLISDDNDSDNVQVKVNVQPMDNDNFIDASIILRYIENSYYYITFRGGTYNDVTIGLYNDGSFSQIDNVGGLSYNNSTTKYDVIEASIEGYTITGWLNGDQVIQATDDTQSSSSGNIGLGCWESENTHVNFDNVQIRGYSTLEPQVTLGSEVGVTGGLGEIVAKGDAYSLILADGTLNGIINQENVSAPLNNGWQHIVLTYDKNAGSNNQKLYVNGELQTQRTLTGQIQANSNSLTIGDPIAFKGIIDEVRISNLARSAGWISTEFNNENSPSTFYSIGSEEMYQVKFDQTGLDNTATGTIITINGLSLTLENLPYFMWVDNGTILNYSYSSTVSSTVGGKQFIENNVTGKPSPITINGPEDVMGNYVAQYTLTMAANLGTTSPSGVNWENAGTVLTISATAPGVGAGEQYVWNGWTGVGTDSYTGNNNPANNAVTMNEPITETASWTHQYQLTMDTNAGTTTPAVGTSWQTAGSTVSIDASVPGGYVWNNWTGSGTGSYSGSTKSSSVTMNGPITENASWLTALVHDVTKDTWYTTIQAAINDANPGDTIEVGTGTFREAIIDNNKSLTIKASSTPVIEAPDSVPLRIFGAQQYRPIVLVCGNSNTTIEGLTIDGRNLCSANQPGFVGIQYFGASGTIENNIVRNIRDNTLSGSNGVGILVNHLHLQYNAQSVEISGNQVSTYQKNGITCNEPGTLVTVDNNIVTGAGPVSVIAQNGIQIGFGATGTVRNNVVSGNSYKLSSWGAAGILVLDNSVDVLGNQVDNNGIGIYVSNSSGDISGNTISASTAGTGLSAFTGILIFPNVEVVATYTNSVTNNTLIGDGNGASCGIEVYAYTDYAYTTISINYTGFRNTVNDWGYGYLFYEEEPPSIINATENFSTITGNLYGMYAQTPTGSTNAAYNWWGDTSGPSGDGSGTGDAVYGAVFAPWLRTPVGLVWTGISPSDNSGANGATLNYTVTVQNTDVSTHTFDLTDNAAPSWLSNLSPTSLTIPAGENRTATFSVTVPSDAIGGTVDNIQVTATSEDNAAVFDSNSCLARVKVQYNLTMATNFGTTSPSVGDHLENENAVVDISATAPSAGPGERYVWNGWTGTGLGSYTGTNNSASVTMYENITETASWTLQYTLTMVTNFGDTSPSVGGHWENAGLVVNISATPPSAGAGENYIFNGWTGTGTGNYTGPDQSASVTMNGPITENASWTHRYYLTVTSPYGTPGGAGWYDSGSTANATLSSGTESGGAGTQYVFTNWSGDASGTGLTSDEILMNGPKTATAVWKTQYYLTVTSTYGSPTEAGWYDNGSSASFGVTTPVLGGAGTQYVFTGWSSSDSGGYTGPSASHSVTMNNPITETASWKTQYEVTFAQSGLDNTAIGTVVTVAGVPKTYGVLPFTTDWMDSGFSLSFKYSDNVSSSVPGKQFALVSVSSGSPLIVTAPTTVTGTYTTQAISPCTGTASIRLATSGTAPFLWGTRKVTVTLNLVVNQGDNLRLIFLTYDNKTVENEVVIWSRTSPGAQTVIENLVVLYNSNLPANYVKRVKLVLTDSAGATILDNMSWYTVVQDDWSNRISKIILSWSSHNSTQQDQLSNEISAIILNWANVQTTTDQHDFSQP